MALIVADVGSAGSPNICVANACISEAVLPHFIASASNASDPATWHDAISITKFHNGSGGGGATATHVVLTTTFSSPAVQIVSSSTQDGSGTAVPGTCTTTSTSTTLARSCDVGNVAGGGTVKLVIRFATNTSMNQPGTSTSPDTRVKGSVTYAESGNDNPGGPNGAINDSHAAFDSLTVGGTLQGDCFDSTSPTVAAANAVQATTASVGQAAMAGIPCTPALAGVEPKNPGVTQPAGFTRDISFTEFLPITGNAFGTVFVDFLTGVPKGFVLKELVDAAAPASDGSWVELKKCGEPTLSPDSCISGTKNLPKGALRYILSVRGTGVDPKYSG